MNKRDICSYDYEELKEEMARIGEQPFRSRQIYEWLHVKLADDFQDMTNLSKKLREKLDGEYEIARVQISSVRSRRQIRQRSSSSNCGTGI